VQITSYVILIRDKNGDLVSDPDCDGTLASVIETRVCSIPMTSFLENHELVIGDLIIASVKAINEKGEG
jgi:hypothetical protein